MGGSCRPPWVTDTLEFSLSEMGAIKWLWTRKGQELKDVLRFPSGCRAENRLKEDRETSEEVITQARAMGAAQTLGGNGDGEKRSDSGHVPQAGTTGSPDRVDMEHARAAPRMLARFGA